MSSDSDTKSSPPISLRVSNQKAYVWNVDDIEILRTRHRICGVLAGTLPHLGQQNIFLGVPLVLMPEEVVFLVEQQLAVLVNDPPSHSIPTLAQLQAYDTARTESARQQTAHAEAKEAAGIGRDMSEAAIQKRKEREEKRKVKAPPEVPSRDKHAYNISIPASSESLEWYKTAENVFTTISAAKKAGIWSYPATLHERALCGVFKSLWEQGFYMGGGIKFGGDFLVYPGDPLRYHSHFSAIVIDSPISVLRPMEIIAYGRLGTATKKAYLLCGWDDDDQDVTYYSIEWAGFG